MAVRYRLDIEYDGRPFCGWQRQADLPTVQQALEDAAFQLCGQRVLVQGSGRTDSGVHAFAQVAHVDLPKAYGDQTVANALNARLRPLPIAVLCAQEVDDDFHARFSALERGYIYLISNRRAQPALDAGRVWWIGGALDVPAMDKAAQHLIGRHDFSTFRASECQAESPVKTLAALRVYACENDQVVITARARSFLHHQVRNMVGTLVQVGLGRWRPDHVKTALVACDRSAGGPTAPADGLYFRAVRYGEGEVLSDLPPACFPTVPL